MSAALSWDSFRPNGSYPQPSPETLAALDVAQWRREGRLVDEAIVAVARRYERCLLEERFEELQADLSELEDQLKSAEEERDEAQEECKELRNRLEGLASEDERAAAIERATKLAHNAKLDADHWREMHGRAVVHAERESRASLDLREAMRRIVGDSPDAVALVAYWHGEAIRNGAELIALRKKVAELETPSGRAARSLKQMKADLEHWKKKAFEAMANARETAGAKETISNG